MSQTNITRGSHWGILICQLWGRARESAFLTNSEWWKVPSTQSCIQKP